MSLSSTVSLGALRLQAQDRADLEGSPAISTPMWNQYISQSYKELYDLLVAAYGNEYYVKAPFPFSTTGTQFYNLPPDFYKLLGVDLQSSVSANGWISLKRFEFMERNKYSYLSPATLPSGQNGQIWYIPEPTSLQFLPICSTTLNSTTVGVSDAADLSVGMSAVGLGLQKNTTVTAVNTTLNQVTLSLPALMTQPIVTLQFWTDAVTIDGISGWEEYIIVDAAIKANIKQEFDVNDLRIQKAEMKARIESMAEGRDAGQAHHVTDAMSINGCFNNFNSVSFGFLRYRLMGNQLELVAIADDQDAGGGGGGWY